MELIDYIDPDEGRDFPAPFFTEGEPCENCGATCDSGSRTWIPGFDYWACNDCAEECQILIFAEANCPTLEDAIVRSRSIAQVRQAYEEHKETCPKCNPKLKEVPRKQPPNAAPAKYEEAA